MTLDSLDDLLDRSAPPPDLTPQSDLDAMVAEARAAVLRPRRGRVVVAAGVLVVLLAGGVGVAAATDGFAWAPWAQNPVRAVSFTMDNGFECELRFSAYTAGSDQGFLTEVNNILEDWYRSADVIGDVRALVPATREALGPIDLQPGETLDTLPAGEAEHREWVREWQAWDQAVGEAESQELARHGIQPGDSRFAGSERNGQIQCLDQNHVPYLPGAGS